MPTAVPDPERTSPFILGEAHPGDLGVIIKVRTGGDRDPDGLTAREIELRLLEFGFVEGDRVEVLHAGPIGGDPIAVRVDGIRIALRRAEAMNVILTREAA
ncbi:MAG: ferrous iron transport protein A [Phenylobacterium sp.]